MANQEQYPTAKIVNGPNKFDFMLALFDNKPAPKRRFVTFKLEECRLDELEVWIDKVERKDGSCERWLYAGWSNYAGGGGAPCYGEYNTHDRKGVLTVETKFGI